MNKTIFRMAAVAALLGAGTAALAQLPTQPYLFGLWEGVMSVVPQQDDGNGLAYPFNTQEQFPFRLDIKDTNLVIHVPDGQGGFIPVGQDADLRLNQAGRSAIVIAAMSDGSDGGPTDTWMLNITRWNEEQIAVYWSQVQSADAANGTPVRASKYFGFMERISQ
jgi:hypothetical protein